MTRYKELKEKAVKDKAVQDLTPEYVEWSKEGQSILGQFVAATPVKSSLSEGYYNQYLMNTDDGLIKFAMGGAADNEYSHQLEIGDVYEITFLGQLKISSNRRVNKFKVVRIARSSELPATEAGDDVF